MRQLRKLMKRRLSTSSSRRALFNKSEITNDNLLSISSIPHHNGSIAVAVICTRSMRSRKYGVDLDYKKTEIMSELQVKSLDMVLEEVFGF